MQSFAHWSPRYVTARALDLVNQRLHPDDPWLSRRSVKLLQDLLRPSDTALEFGSGRSTRWFARRVKHVTSVEHNADWHATGVERLKFEQIANVDLLLRPKDFPDSEGLKAAYTRVVDLFADGSIDFCLVDGVYRGACALSVLPKLRPGALLVIDNSHWFIPSQSSIFRARKPGDMGYDPDWDAFIAQTSDWRRIWTTSGVSDTLLIFKS